MNLLSWVAALPFTTLGMGLQQMIWCLQPLKTNRTNKPKNPKHANDGEASLTPDLNQGWHTKSKPTL